MEITDDFLAAGASSQGGFSRQQVELLGITWPPQRGWKKTIIGNSIPDEIAEEFISLSNQHLVDRAQKKAQPLNLGGATEPVAIHLYVLSLTDDHFYVGLTHDVDRRLEQHFSGKGAEWTKLHPPRRLVHTICTGTTDARQAEQMEDEATVAMMLDYGIDKVRGGHFCSLEQELIEVELLRRGLWERIKRTAFDRHAFKTQGSWASALENFIETALRYYDAGAPKERHDVVFAACYSLTRYSYWSEDFVPGLSWQFWNHKGILPVLLSFKLGRPVASRLPSSYDVLAAALNRGRNGKHPLRRIFLLAWQAYLPPTTPNQAETVARFMSYLDSEGEFDRQYDEFITILFPELRHLFRHHNDNV